MKETKLYQKVKRLLPKMRATRIENSVELGTPDTHWQGWEGSFWAELKSLNVRITNYDQVIKPDWQPGQVGWGKNHIKFGGKWFLFISIGEHIFLTNLPQETYLFKELTPFTSFHSLYKFL